jgi:hypothetical protein
MQADLRKFLTMPHQTRGIRDLWTLAPAPRSGRTFWAAARRRSWPPAPGKTASECERCAVLRGSARWHEPDTACVEVPQTSGMCGRCRVALAIFGLLALRRASRAGMVLGWCWDAPAFPQVTALSWSSASTSSRRHGPASAEPAHLRFSGVGSVPGRPRRRSRCGGSWA